MARFSSMVQRIADGASDVWEVHWKGTQMEAAGEDVIFLSIGDPDFATPEPIVARAVAALQGGDTHYSEFIGRQELRAAVAARFAATSGVPVTHENVVITAGTQNALFSAALCLLEAGDEVVTFEPLYATYPATLQAGGAKLVTVPSSAASGFRPDPERLAAAITPRTRAIVLTTPANPTGVMASDDELAGIASLAVEHDLWVVADEVYADLVYEGRHRSIASLPGMAERTATVSSLSKSHAMTGWRCGWVIGPTALTAHLSDLNIAMIYGIPGFIQEAAVEALARADEVTAEMRARYRRRRDLAVELLAEAEHLPILSPVAGMYLMADIRHFGLTSHQFTHTLLERRHVSTLDGGAFGGSTQGWIRLAFTVSEERLAEACQRIVSLTRELARA